MKLIHCLLAVIGIIICSFGYTQGAETDVKSSWDNAVIFLPDTTQRSNLIDMKTDKPYPVAIFMHGCSGIEDSNFESYNWARLIAQQGVLVILPNSMARNDRQPSCDPKKLRGGLFPPVHGMRLEEIKFASDMIKKQPWFDGKNLFLMGFSEGAVAVVRTKLTGFRGVIATGWTCTNSKLPAFDGIFLPPDTPLLTINYTDDPWYTAETVHGNCGSKSTDRLNAQNITISGRGHGTYNSEQATKAVADFVKKQLQSP